MLLMWIMCKIVLGISYFWFWQIEYLLTMEARKNVPHIMKLSMLLFMTLFTKRSAVKGVMKNARLFISILIRYLLKTQCFALVYFTLTQGEVETQCYPDYEPKCKTDYKTGYKQFCSTIEDTECYFVSKSFSKTVYSKKCSTSYKKSCHDVGYGYHKEKKCTSHPVHKVSI